MLLGVNNSDADGIDASSFDVKEFVEVGEFDVAALTDEFADGLVKGDDAVVEKRAGGCEQPHAGVSGELIHQTPERERLVAMRQNR